MVQEVNDSAWNVPKILNECIPEDLWQQYDEVIQTYVVELLSSPDSYDDLESLTEQVQGFLLQVHDDCVMEAYPADTIQSIAQNVIQTLATKQNENRSDVKNISNTRVPRMLDSFQVRKQGTNMVQSVKSVGDQDQMNWQDNSVKDQSISAELERTSADNKTTKTRITREDRQRMRADRKERMQQQHQQQRQQSSSAIPLLEPTLADDELASNDDYGTAWQECLIQGQTWGGRRGYGGRGAYAGATNSVKSNIHLDAISLLLENGTELLHNTVLDISAGHCYGLLGRNGVGKSTLLQRLAQHAIPGMPHDMRVLLVRQEMHGSATQSALDVLIQSDTNLQSLLQEQTELENMIAASSQSPEETTNDDKSDDQLAALVDRLNQVQMALDGMEANSVEERAMEILKGLQFTNDRIRCPTEQLSGGWRMRLALARALFVPDIDLLLLDECTNHLDLHGLQWLIQYLTDNDVDDRNFRTLIVVSHDRAFLEAICTDILVMEHQQISHHIGTYSDYERQVEEKAARESQILDAAGRQRVKAEAFVQKQQAIANKKSADPNKQRQAKMIREKKLDRIGNYREDGKRYKLYSLQKMSEDYIRLAQKVEIVTDEPVLRMRFPHPVWPTGIGPNDPVIRFEDFSFKFGDRVADNINNDWLLQHVTLSLHRSSKVALVGPNGAGKSTLVKLIAGDHQSKLSNRRHHMGELWTHPNLRVGHVTQYSVEELVDHYGHMTVVTYAEQVLMTKKASADILAKASGNVRQYLGGFGLGSSRHAHLLIRKLSGGERMRLCFATVLADQPHVLLLDESTNHVDLETLDSMSDGLKEFPGAVIMVSHNPGFLNGFCQELWVLDHGRVMVHHSDDSLSFADLFHDYRSSILSVGSSQMRSKHRQQKAVRANQATQQRSGARQNTALL